MAKQVGPLFFTGTVDGIIFYKLGDHYYIRSKGDYKSGKQMRKDANYKRTMQKADQFGAASKLVKPIYYRHLPKEVRKHGLYGQLTGMANRWLQEGKSKASIQEALLAHCEKLASAATPVITVSTPKPAIQAESVVNKPCVKTAGAPSTKPLLHTTKQARYLSRWRVKINGRLHIPKQQIIVGSTLLDAKAHDQLIPI